MPGHRPASRHRPTGRLLAAIATCLILMVGAVSAETIDIHEYGQIREESYFEPTHMVHHHLGRINTGGNPISAPFSLILTTNVTNNNASITHNEVPIVIKGPSDNNVYATGRCGYYINPGENNSQIYLHIDTGGIPGPGNYKISDANKSSYVWGTLDHVAGLMHDNNVYPWPDHPYFVAPDNAPLLAGNYVIYTNVDFRHNITYTETELTSGIIDTVTVNRNIDGVYYDSTVQIYNKNGMVVNNTDASDTVTSSFSSDYRPYVVKIYADMLHTWLTYTLYERDDIPPTPVTVYVRNSQTGALLADAHIVISASVDGEFHEVINETLPGGMYNGPLQPTGGGLPNPDYYRLVASADGYNPVMPYMDFEHGSATTLFVEMEPTTGGPVDENKTFIEFYVRDMVANPISGATVTCGPYTLITNSAGYTQFEMPVNATYPYTVSKSGYVTIEGRVTVADGPRYVVNVVLGPGTVPTNPPATDPGGPGATPTPTPTGWGPGQWTPDPDESLGDNARGAAKQTLLEGLQAGQLLFTLCILVLIMAVLDSRRR